MKAFPAVDAFRGGPGLIRVVGHRGARGVLPENAMVGFEFALTTGAPLLEFDVVLTADDVPVITHNTCLHAPTFRGPDGAFIAEPEPKVSSLTWEDLQAFDIGRIDGASAYGQRFPDQAQLDGIRVPKLMDLCALAACKRHAGAHLMLELKSDPDVAQDAAHRAKVVSRVLDDVRAAGLEARTLLHSFDWTLLAECKRQAPDMAISFLTQLPENADEIGEDSAKQISPDFKGRTADIPDMVVQAGGVVWCPYLHDVTARDVARAKDLGLCIAVWTVNEAEDIERMIALEVDAIVTDYPGRVQRKLADHGLAWMGPV